MNFFVTLRKISFIVLDVRLMIFRLCVSNFSCFSASVKRHIFFSNCIQNNAFFKNRTHINNSGFTLIEVLVVVTIITLIVGATLFFDVNSYRGEAFRSERNILVIALQKARADALNNVNQKRHGVKINPPDFEGYVLFEGNDYLNSDPATHEEFPASYTVTLEPPSPDEIVFNQLSGNVLVGGTAYDGEIVLNDPERNATTGIIINHEGKIGW